MKKSRKPQVTMFLIIAMVLSSVCLAYAESSSVLADAGDNLPPCSSSSGLVPHYEHASQGEEIGQSVGSRESSDYGDLSEGEVLEPDPTGSCCGAEIEDHSEGSENYNGPSNVPPNQEPDLQVGVETDGTSEDTEPVDVGDLDENKESTAPLDDPDYVDAGQDNDYGETKDPESEEGVDSPTNTNPQDEIKGQDEVDLGAQESEIDKSPEPTYVSVVIEHVLKFNGMEQLLSKELLGNVEVGTSVVGAVYALTQPDLEFLGSDPEVLLVGEDQNLMRLFYGIVSPNLPEPEAPDFPAGEGVEIESPYIEVIQSVLDLTEKNAAVAPAIARSVNNTYDDEVGNIAWPEPGSLYLCKDAEPVEGCGYQWDVTLSIEGINLVETSDIVLVIDCSNSMQDNSKIVRAKEAAKAFVNNLLTEESQGQTRIAVVTFASFAQVESAFCDYSGKSDLLTAINQIGANWGDYGGTHIQAGIRRARNLLGSSSADHKNIVFLGDGAATYSYNLRSFSPAYFDYWYSEEGFNYYRSNSTIPENKFNYGSTIGNGTSNYYYYGYDYNGEYYIRHGASAAAEAGFAKRDGIEIYSIALSAGPEGEWTLEEVASDGKYYETYHPSFLEEIFLEIAGRIAHAAENAVVTDPIGSMFYIPGMSSDNVSDFVEVSHGQVYFDESSRAIRWDIGTISQGNIYTMKYRVYMSFDANLGEDYPTNGPTPIDYLNVYGAGARKYFNIPMCKMRGVTFEKLLDDTAYQHAEFDVKLEGPDGPYKQLWTVSLTPGGRKTVKGLLPGTYTVKEIVPMNFELVEMIGDGVSEIDSAGIYQLVICDDDWDLEVLVENERSNEGWFWDDHQVVNTFQVGNYAGGISGAHLVIDNLFCALVPKSYRAEPESPDSNV
ncbi:MAG TPA: VWA domain-containing protein [Bacillota bacterium]|nr:VWA domain-containing protein [Bacillota bacterium]